MATNDFPLKVSGATDAGKLAKSIAMTLRERESASVRVRAMGPQAVNQLVKALIISRQLLVAQGLDLSYVFGFDTQVEHGEEVTVIQAHVVLEA